MQHLNRVPITWRLLVGAILITTVVYQSRVLAAPPTPPPAPPTPPPASSRPVGLELRGTLPVLAQFGDSRSGTHRGTHCVRSVAQWQALGMVPIAGGAPLAAPKIDFARQMLLVALAGGHTSGGYEIRISQVEVDDKEVKVEVVEHGPGAGCPTLAVMTAPLHVVVVPRVDRPVRFSSRTEPSPSCIRKPVLSIGCEPQVQTPYSLVAGQAYAPRGSLIQCHASSTSMGSIQYGWQQRPPRSHATLLADPDGTGATFKIDRPGRYVVRVTALASDGQQGEATSIVQTGAPQYSFVLVPQDSTNTVKQLRLEVRWRGQSLCAPGSKSPHWCKVKQTAQQQSVNVSADLQGDLEVAVRNLRPGQPPIHFAVNVLLAGEGRDTDWPRDGEWQRGLWRAGVLHLASGNYEERHHP